MCPRKRSCRSCTVCMRSFLETDLRTMVLRTLSNRLTPVIDWVYHYAYHFDVKYYYTVWEQERMHYRSGTAKSPADASCKYTHQMVAVFSRNDVMTAILKVWCQIKNRTIVNRFDVYLLKEQSCQISSRSDVKRRSLISFFRRGRPNKNENNNSYVKIIP